MLIWHGKGWTIPATQREFLDINTGERVMMKTNDTFFFIPIRYWSYLLLSIGTAILLFGPNPSTDPSR